MQIIRKKCAANRQFHPRIVVFFALALLLAACQHADEPLPESVSAPARDSACGEAGFLTTALIGAVTTEVAWDTMDLACEGMPRPAGAGARLRFAGTQDEQPIVFIVALPGLERGKGASELETTVTLIEEGTGRFFSNTSAQHCLTDITGIDPLDATGDRVAIGGTVFCIQPLVRVNDRSSVSVPKLEFRGLLDWNAR